MYDVLVCVHALCVCIWMKPWFTHVLVPPQVYDVILHKLSEDITWMNQKEESWKKIDNIRRYLEMVRAICLRSLVRVEYTSACRFPISLERCVRSTQIPLL
jgi:hypothetical protein